MIESTEDYKRAVNRIAAIDSVIEHIQNAKAMAVGCQHVGQLTNDDMGAIAPLGDAIADLAYQRNQLDQQCREWEYQENYA